MRFRLVPKSVTLNDLKRRNGPLVCVISPNSVAFGATLVLAIYHLCQHSQRSPRTSALLSLRSNIVG